MKRRSLLVRMGLAALICPTSLVATAHAQTGLRTREAPTERNRNLVRRWIEEGFNKQRLLVVDELFAERIVVNGQLIGRDGLKQSMTEGNLKPWRLLARM